MRFNPLRDPRWHCAGAVNDLLASIYPDVWKVLIMAVLVVGAQRGHALVVAYRIGLRGGPLARRHVASKVDALSFEFDHNPNVATVACVHVSTAWDG